MLKRVTPEAIRYMRLNKSRQTEFATIVMPPKTDEAHKYVREAVQAFPELYFSRLVILGEGDSEEIILPRLFNAKGSAADEAAISVVPLGGRHVNHFWRLLHALNIPFVTLLDLDLARYQGGWGRIKNILDQINEHAPDYIKKGINDLDPPPKWNDDDKPLKNNWHDYRRTLEANGVFFTCPLDLDFAMLKQFPDAYDVAHADMTIPDDDEIKAVLGKKYHGVEQYSEDEQKLFITYHKRFKLGSKPAAHLNALANLDDDELVANMPASLSRLVDAVIAKLEGIPE